MTFDTGSLLSSMLVSSVGFVLLSYGRKMTRPPHMLIGFILLAYPYFISDVVIMLAIAVVMLGGLWFATRLGW